jgi:hypothetical protein
VNISDKNMLEKYMNMSRKPVHTNSAKSKLLHATLKENKTNKKTKKNKTNQNKKKET